MEGGKNTHNTVFEVAISSRSINYRFRHLSPKGVTGISLALGSIQPHTIYLVSSIRPVMTLQGEQNLL